MSLMILIGKSGSGKDTIRNALVEQEGLVNYAVENEDNFSNRKYLAITVSSNEIADPIIKMMNNSYEYYDNLFLQAGGDKEKEGSHKQKQSEKKKTITKDDLRE